MSEEVKHVLILLENHIALSDDEDKIVLDYIKDLQNRIDKAIEIIESYNLGKYDYSVPPGGIIDLLKILKGKE